MGDYINLDERERFGYNIRPNRVNEQALPTLKPTVQSMEDPTKVFDIKNLGELDQLAEDYYNTLIPGNMAILYDVGGMPAKLFAWSGEKKWQEVPSKSVLGDVLIEGSTSNKGTVQFADHGETASNKAVQSDDPILKQMWISGPTPPSDKSLLWINTSSPIPDTMWFNGNAWVSINSKMFIDDSNISDKLTYSSKVISDGLNSKAAINHTHTNMDNHLGNTSNPHKVTASQLPDIVDVIDKNSTVQEAFKKRHDHSNKGILDKITDNNGSLLYMGNQIGKGDMLLSNYDKTGSGIIDKARVITDGSNIFDIVKLLGIESKAHTHLNDSILSKIEEAFTTTMKAKLEGIADKANLYVHPNKHTPDIIIQDSSNRFVNDTQISSWNDKYTKTDTDKLLNTKENTANKGKAGGYASLDSSGKINIAQIPVPLKETKVVKNYAELNTLTKYSGLRAVVADTSSNPDMGAGTAEYIWSGTDWIMINTTAQMNNVQSSTIVNLVCGSESDRYSTPPTDGTVFFAIDTKKIYLYLDGKCVSFVGNTTTGGGTGTTMDQISETVFLPAGQNLITIHEGRYATGEDNISISIDGSTISNLAFIEINDHQIQLKQPIDEDCIVVVTYFAITQ